ncbi:Doublecortin domain-containing protein 5 [Cricetulus griseus]|uniref:Doublecortin domain-containing protein 5 n=1 Tax=Cricetulus griseus TaxID=10029 RepID=G3GZA3_CRIGR|nr:Doublecortin domain-containing protein 5 [Cricetulus griseus]
MEACCRMLKYAWQDPSYNLKDDGSLPKKMEIEPFENVQPQKKHRTIHLVSNPNLVLAVSMTKAQNEAHGYPVIIQKYKPYGNGAANQKWHYMENTRTFIAFHSTALDKEVTAANSSGLCTSSVTKENIDQPGYCYLSPDGKKKMMLCLACGQSMRAGKGLKQLLPGVPFFCVSGSEQKSLARRPFKVISIAKVLIHFPAELLYCPCSNNLETSVHLDWPHFQVQLRSSTSSSSDAPSHPASMDFFLLIVI